MSKLPKVVHQFGRGPLEIKQLKEQLGDGVAAIFKPVEGRGFQSTVQVEAIDHPGDWFLSIAGKLTRVEAQEA